MSGKEHELVKNVIKGRTTVYYLTNDKDLSNLKAHSFAADVTFLISSLSLGAYISGKDRIFLLIGLLGLLVSGLFYYLKVSYISSLKKSGEVESLFTKDKETNELKIIKASYGTTSEKTIDITNNVREKIHQDRLDVFATNELAGQDPDIGTVKYLEIEYSYAGNRITKKYREGDRVELP